MKSDRVHIIIVDDEPHVCETLREFLEAQGHVVRTAGSGEEALQLPDLEQMQVAMIDIHLKGSLSGHDLVDQLNERIPDAAKILMSGRGEIDDLITAFENRVFTFVNKPFKSLKEVDLQIRRAAESKRHEIASRAYTRDLEAAKADLEARIAVRTADLERMRHIVSHLFSVSSRLGSIEPLDSLLNFLCESIVSAGAFQRVVVVLADPQFTIRHVGAAEANVASTRLADRARAYRDTPLRPFDFGRGDSLIGGGIYSIPVEAISPPAAGEGEWAAGGQLTVPFRRHDGRVFGYLSVANPHDGGRPSEEIVKYLDILLRHSTLQVEAQEIRAELRRKADELEKTVDERTRELRQSQEKYSRLVNLTTDIVYITDVEWKLVYLNDAFADRLGYVRENYIGHGLRTVLDDLVTDDPANREQIDLLTGQADEPTLHHIELLTRHGDKRVFEINRTVIRQGGEFVGTQGIARDITEHRALMKRVMSSERLAATGRLAAGIAHEINNPLQAITSHLNALSEKPDRETRQKNVDHIRDGIDRIRTIVRGMLDLHRTQAAATVDVDLNGIIEKVLALTGRQLRSGGVEIVRRLADDLSLIQGAPQDLQQVILNLVLNASEAMPGGGTLTVSSQNEDEHAVISVRDTGAGITEENQRRIFEPFFSARVTGGGVGLGLYLARNTVEIHQGTISVESIPGKGSTFTLRFPKR